MSSQINHMYNEKHMHHGFLAPQYILKRNIYIKTFLLFRFIRKTAVSKFSILLSPNITSRLLDTYAEKKHMKNIPPGTFPSITPMKAIQKYLMSITQCKPGKDPLVQPCITALDVPMDSPTPSATIMYIWAVISPIYF